MRPWAQEGQEPPEARGGSPLEAAEGAWPTPDFGLPPSEL